MKNIFFILAVFLISGTCFGQVSGFDPVAGNDRSWNDMQIGTVFEEVPILGSPYLDEMYRMGVADVNGKKIRLLMRFDAYNNQVEMKDRNQKSFNLLKKENLEATFNGRTYRVMEFNENGEKVLAYVNPLNEGEAVLYFRPRKVFVQAEKPDHGYDVYDPPRYKDDHAYYLQVGSQAPQEIKLSKGSVLRVLRDKAPQLKDFISEMNLKVRTEAEVLAVVKHYNNLVSGL